MLESASERASCMDIFRSRRRVAKQLKVASLSSTSPLGAYCTQEEIRELARCCSVRSFAIGAELWESPFYLVLTGEISVIGANGMQLCTRSSGSFFSRHAGMGVMEVIHQSQNAKSAELMAATGEVQTILKAKRKSLVLLVTAEGRLMNFLEKCSPVAFHGYDAIVSTNMATRLNGVGFLKDAGLAGWEFSRLGEMCLYVALQKNEVLFRQGDPTDAFFIVLQGAVEVVINEQAYAPTAQAATKAQGVRYEAGDVIGLAAVALSAPERMSTIVCIQRTLLLVVSAVNFETFISVNSRVHEAAMAMAKRAVLRNFSKLNNNIFHQFTQKELEMAAKVAKIEKLKRDEVVYSIGDAPRAFFVVVHGSVSFEVAKDGVLKTVVLKAGSHFGEMGVLLRRTDCLSTVKAAQDCTLLSIGTAEWQQVFPDSSAHSIRPGRALHTVMQLNLLVKLRKVRVPTAWLSYAPTVLLA